MLINPLFLLTGGVGIAMHTKTPLPSTSRLRVPEADLDQVIQVIQDSSLPTSILVHGNLSSSIQRFVSHKGRRRSFTKYIVLKGVALNYQIPCYSLRKMMGRFPSGEKSASSFSFVRAIPCFSLKRTAKD